MKCGYLINIVGAVDRKIRNFIGNFSQVLVIACAVQLVSAPISQEASAADETGNTIPEIALPLFWSPAQSPGKPVLAEIQQIRFLTTSDFPPFNFIDARGELVGFNIDLAREICTVLELVCTIRAGAWDKLAADLGNGTGDAIVASLALTPENRDLYDFSERYYTTPARFAARADIGAPKLSPDGLKGQKIGVIRNTAHAAYIGDFFSTSERVQFDDRDALRKALQDREITFMFDDGISMMFWLDSVAAEGCCVFVGGPFTESYYFGEGVAIAVAKGNDKLRTALNYGLREVHKSGKFLEIFLRHFPQSFY